MIVRTMCALRVNTGFRKSIDYRGLSSFLAQRPPKIPDARLYNDTIARCPRSPPNDVRCVSSMSSVTFPSWFVALSNSTPVAYAQHFVVSFHEMTGTPWWASLMLSAVALRLVVTLPLTAYQVGKIIFLSFQNFNSKHLNIYCFRCFISSIIIF